jgi:hypothetical protein
MAQAITPQPLNSEAKDRSQVSPCEIRGGQSGTGTAFLLTVSFHKRFVLIFIFMLLLAKGQTDEVWAQKSGRIGYQSTNYRQRYDPRRGRGAGVSGAVRGTAGYRGKLL